MNPNILSDGKLAPTPIIAKNDYPRKEISKKLPLPKGLLFGLPIITISIQSLLFAGILHTTVSREPRAIKRVFKRWMANEMNYYVPHQGGVYLI